MSLTDLDNDGIAMDGMDPVAYFNGESLVGDTEITTELRGVEFRFANKENYELFVADPAKYIPDYAGSFVQRKEGEEVGRLVSRGMNDDVIEPLEGTIDPEMKTNPGFETDDEVEMSNLSDSEA